MMKKMRRCYLLVREWKNRKEKIEKTGKKK
jgi:hypothetical protein